MQAAGEGFNRHADVGYAVIVTAAGSSVRFNGSSGILDGGCISKAPVSAPTGGMVKKEFLELDGVSILARSILPFLSVPGLQTIVVTYRKGLREATEESLGGVLGKYALDGGRMVEIHFVEGGDTRQKSVFNALSLLNEMYGKESAIELVAIHDGARPFVSSATIAACLDAAAKVGGAAPCTPVRDTLVKVEDGLVCTGIDRTDVYGVQTPQVFSFPQIYDAHMDALRHEGVYFTDDTQIFVAYGGSVAAVPGDLHNIKVTFRDDLAGVFNG